MNTGWKPGAKDEMLDGGVWGGGEDIKEKTNSNFIIKIRVC